jgi:hypothetical protein
MKSAECLSIFEISKVFFIVLSFSKPVPSPDDFDDTLEILERINNHRAGPRWPGNADYFVLKGISIRFNRIP